MLERLRTRFTEPLNAEMISSEEGRPRAQSADAIVSARYLPLPGTSQLAGSVKSVSIKADINVRVNVLPTKTIRAASVSIEMFLRRDKFEDPMVVDTKLQTRQLCSPQSAGMTD